MHSYRGRIAPSPTGFLHLGHARTFWVAHQRARAASGNLVFRNEDLDIHRCKPQFVSAMYEDLRWLGLDWDEGPDAGGPFGPYVQSQRREFYLAAWHKLRDEGSIYPCTCSRKDLDRALQAPHEDDDEAPYPGTCREKISTASDWKSPAGVSWRFKVPDGRAIAFDDRHFGRQEFIAGTDFADFLVWRRDDVPSYQLAVVVDDAAMQITEVVRGEDLLKSAARQLLLLEALGCPAPDYFHCPLLRDENNQRLAKRHDALSLRRLREQGVSPQHLHERFAAEIDWDRGMRAG
ncbi:MAG TPA: tRNA glutamyl-Q(34) synthetase GluQRS [Candidatus Angelobacter sp.]|nr:tRNA glutamyl-Q(34) synthetase GluQRS [Candidatus Angelobacter sp.]